MEAISYRKGFHASTASENFIMLRRPIGKLYCSWIFGGTNPDLYNTVERERRLEEDIPFNQSRVLVPFMASL